MDLTRRKSYREASGARLSRKQLAMLIFCFVPGLCWAQSTDMPELSAASRSFEAGEFENVIQTLSASLTKLQLPADERQAASEKLALAYVGMNKEAEAREVFTGLLEENAAYEPDSRWWPYQRLMENYYQAVEHFGAELPARSTPSAIRTIAVLDFENNSVENREKYQNLGKAMAKIVIADLGRVGALKVVERERIQYVLDELKMQQRRVNGQPLFDQTTTARLGKLLGAHVFVFGSLIQIDGKMRIDARLVLTETSEVLSTASVTGKSTKILDLTGKLSVKIAKDMKVRLEKADAKALEQWAGGDIPVEALALFGDAMSAAMQEDFSGAYAKLEKALGLAPHFDHAAKMQQVLQPMVNFLN